MTLGASLAHVAHGDDTKPSECRMQIDYFI